VKKENKDKRVNLNLMISNEMFSLLDTLRASILLETKHLPTRSHLVRELLSEALKAREVSK